ncbi:MAG: hypothetical protein IT244_13060, partial [Bacteroidia bacterium]|nr:hypothetical protein [Bacteroidia bacterium]
MFLQLIHRGWIKKIAVFTAIQIVVQLVAPIKLYALTSGPDQPEFNKFQQVGANDMVDLFTGDLKYNIPLFDVGGYPVNLVYEGGVGMDQEASWTGLGWNLNVGAINRQLRGLPDEFNNNDEIRQTTNLKKHVVINFSPKAVKTNKYGKDGKELGEIPILKVKYKPALNMSLIHDNYKGWGVAYNFDFIDSGRT